MKEAKRKKEKKKRRKRSDDRKIPRDSAKLKIYLPTLFTFANFQRTKTLFTQLKKGLVEGRDRPRVRERKHRSNVRKGRIDCAIREWAREREEGGMKERKTENETYGMTPLRTHPAVPWILHRYRK